MGRSRPARSQLYQAGRGRIAPAPAGDTPTPLQTLYAPSVVRRARAPQSAPAGHRPTGPGQSRHPPRVRSPGRRYPSLRVIGPVVAAEHMSDGRTRARRTFPGTTSMCTTGPTDGRAGRPGHERTPRQALSLAIRVRHGTYSTGVPRQKGAGQPTARLSRRPRGSEAGGLIIRCGQVRPRRKPRQPSVTS